MVTETKKRSLAKSASYRALGTLTTTLIAYALTQKFELAIAAGLIDTFLKLGLYFTHERIWAHVSYGRRNPRGAVLWLTGLPSSGKTTLAKHLQEILQNRGQRVVWLDGDQIRKYFPNVGFSREERSEHIKRVALTASLLEEQGVVVIVSLVSPYKDSRHFARELCQSFHEIYLSANIQDCRARDTKGLYAKADRGEIQNMTGVQDVYEPPTSAELVLATGQASQDQCMKQLLSYLSRVKFG